MTSAAVQQILQTSLKWSTEEIERFKMFRRLCRPLETDAQAEKHENALVLNKAKLNPNYAVWKYVAEECSGLPVSLFDPDSSTHIGRVYNMGRMIPLLSWKSHSLDAGMFLKVAQDQKIDHASLTLNNLLKKLVEKSIKQENISVAPNATLDLNGELVNLAEARISLDLNAVEYQMSNPSSNTASHIDKNVPLLLGNGKIVDTPNAASLRADRDNARYALYGTPSYETLFTRPPSSSSFGFQLPYETMQLHNQIWKTQLIVEAHLWAKNKVTQYQEELTTNSKWGNKMYSNDNIVRFLTSQFAQLLVQPVLCQFLNHVKRSDTHIAPDAVWGNSFRHFPLAAEEHVLFSLMNLNQQFQQQEGQVSDYRLLSAFDSSVVMPASDLLKYFKQLRPMVGYREDTLPTVGATNGNLVSTLQSMSFYMKKLNCLFDLHLSILRLTRRTFNVDTLFECGNLLMNHLLVQILNIDFEQLRLPVTPLPVNVFYILFSELAIRQYKLGNGAFPSAATSIVLDLLPWYKKQQVFDDIRTLIGSILETNPNAVQYKELQQSYLETTSNKKLWNIVSALYGNVQSVFKNIFDDNESTSTNKVASSYETCATLFSVNLGAFELNKAVVSSTFSANSRLDYFAKQSQLENNSKVEVDSIVHLFPNQLQTMSPRRVVVTNMKHLVEQLSEKTALRLTAVWTIVSSESGAEYEKQSPFVLVDASNFRSDTEFSFPMTEYASVSCTVVIEESEANVATLAEIDQMPNKQQVLSAIKWNPLYTVYSKNITIIPAPPS